MAARGEGAVGRSLPRREDGPLLLGQAEFVDDVRAEALAEAAFVRSPLAHGRLGYVDATEALQMPGVLAVLTAADLKLPPLVSACTFPNSFSPVRPMLAEHVVRFVGEAIAIVVAETRYQAEDALERVEVDLEPLTPITDVEAALAKHAPSVHAGERNVYLESRVEAGEVDAAFSAAAAVVECEFRHARVSAAPLEGRGILAAPTERGVRIWSSTQGPHKLRLAVAAALELDLDDVQVVCPEIGGGFGLKAHVYPEEIVVSAAARRLGRPVKWVEDRVENLVGATHAREQRLVVRAAADAQGRLSALDVEQLVDQGAYGSYPHGATLEAHTTAGLLPGPYQLGAYRLHNRAVATTKCPQGAYRGVGFVVAAWVHERVMDMLALELGLDRAEIRRRNLIPPEAFPYRTLTRQQYDSGQYSRALDLALAAVDYNGFAEEQRRARAEGRLLGLGISCYVEPTGMNSAVFEARGMTDVEGYDAAHVTLHEDGATVWTTTPSMGQGTGTTFAQVVADALGLQVEQVTVAKSDTAVGGLRGTGSFASRSAVSGGGAAVEAAGEIRRRLLEAAADRLEAATADLEIGAGAVRVVGSPEASVPIRELLAAAPADHFRFSAQFDPPAVAYPYATHACIVEVDPESGAVSIRRYAVAEDCGRVINPMIVDGQVQGATAQGIAEALYEQVLYDPDGQVQSASFMDYLLPTACEVPTLQIEHLETPSPTSVWGIKGVGEGGTVGAPAAVANAVCDAVGAQLDVLPLTPELIASAARRFRSRAGTKASAP